MFKKEVSPLSEEMIGRITGTINVMEGKGSRPADRADGDVKAQDVSGAESMEKVKEETEITESHYSEGDKVECIKSGMKGTIAKVDPEGKGAYYTVKREDGEMMQYKPEELKAISEEMDPVNPVAVKKKFDDRKDKDIDNDGDTDSSDEYLHKRRKAISKALAKEEVELEEAYTKQQIMKMRQMLGREGQANKKKGVEIFMDKVGVDKNRATAMWKAAMNESVELDEAKKELTPKDVEDYLVKTGVNPKDAKDAVKKGFGYANKKYGGSTFRAALKKVAEVVWTLHEEVDLEEARKSQSADLYFDTYSAAVQKAKADAEKKGYKVDEDDWHNQITTGPGKPGRGKTVRHNIKLTKNGKPARQGLAIQVYNRETDKKTYELNSYVS
jgi:hypothetical protein